MTIRLWCGLPRDGKSYNVVKRKMARMIQGRQVYTNFPLIFIHRGKRYSSLEWKDEYMYEPLVDCDIVLDEAYRSVSCRDTKSFDIDQHTFFCTNGHNGLEIDLIFQAIARCEIIIREIVDEFHIVKKFSIPWFRPNPERKYEKIIWFLDTVYQQGKVLGSPELKPELSLYTARTLFSMTVANAYDTHFYRTGAQIKFQPVSWETKLNLPPYSVTQELNNNVTYYVSVVCQTLLDFDKKIMTALPKSCIIMGYLQEVRLFGKCCLERMNTTINLLKKPKVSKK